MWLVVLGCGRAEWVQLPAPQWVPPVHVEVSTVEQVTDLFVSELPDKVDVLLAVDPELWPAVAAALPSLLDTGLGRDWHVGLTSTALVSAAPGALAWVDLQQADPADVLAAATADGVAPYGALGASWLALDADTTGFLRPDSELHLVAIQAADDATPVTLIDEASWRAWWSGLRSADAGVVHAVAPGGAAVLGGVAASYGPGLVPIEGVGWPDALGAVGRSVLGQVYPLSRAPIEATLELSVELADRELRFSEDDFTFDPAANTVAFVVFVPEPGSTVLARYWTP